MKVVIAGGGVAALEALLALRNLAEDRVSIELLAPRADFSYRPLAVGEPFGLGKARRYDLRRMAEENGVVLNSGTLTEVRTSDRRVQTAEAGSFEYDVLVVAVGARPTTPLEGAITVQGPGYTGRFRSLLSALEAGQLRQVTFAVPPGPTWPLPLYELALMTATCVEERGLRDVELRLVTPESAPLELFGTDASEAVRVLLEQRGIAIHAGLYPAAVKEGELEVVPASHPPVPAEAVVALPQLRGPATPGLPHDSDGFVPVDLHGLVRGETDVYAAGDATQFPIKQGGIATQQADAVAESIAARAGAPITPEPFRPVLRGLLLTGSTPRYMRTEVSGGRGLVQDVADHALWWPPSKVAGRYLSPYLALRHADVELQGRHPGDIPVDLELELEQRSAEALSEGG